ncbi:MAG TPA: 6,7-dimethyl-8-ribityllumazine synthase [Vicinamibacteria bacterium]|nr:6,7-dimethyl-8-ribityllumazine synthase [Vicinamibacteria bacterium]
MKRPPSTPADARGLRVLLLRSAFNASVVQGLVSGAREALRAMGAREGDVAEAEVPGAFELPLAASAAARSGRFDAVVALGAVIRGETDHYEHIAREAASGLAAVARETGIPIGFGVLTVGDEEQARVRSAAGPENKGGEAARAAVATARLVRSWLPRRAARGRRGPAPRRGRSAV